MPRAFLLTLGIVAACVTPDTTKDVFDTASSDDTGAVETDSPTSVVDADNDGYTSDVDCNDLDAGIHPDADEVCNGLDDDCDDLVDRDSAPFEGATGPLFPDNDGDTYGLNGFARWFCTVPDDGWIDVDGDCDDTNAAKNPDTPEVCNGADDDCDQLVDDDDPDLDPVGAPDAVQRWVDADGDTYGGGSARWFCTDPGVGWTTRGGDCDDTTVGRNPGVQETCSGVDDDCDGKVDAEDPSVDPTQVSPHYADGDGDGHGDDGVSRPECTASPTAGWVPLDDDCDDQAAWNFPGNDETCDDRDNDCDRAVDEDDDSLDPGELTTFWFDADGDGFGDEGTPGDWCDAPTGWVDNHDDCVDVGSDGGVLAFFLNPDADEVCNGVDDDCDDDVDDDDDDRVTTNLWYDDDDQDGFGDAATALSTCLQPGGTTTDATDCDDDDGDAFPGAAENESTTVCHRDADDDGWGDTTVSGAVVPGTDCDDDTATTFPGAAELEAVLDCHADADDDGYGDDMPPLGVAVGTDCDDGRDDVNPGADDTWYDGLDQDCAGDDDYDQDLDGDPREGDGGTDCDDEDPLRSGLTAEIPYDGIDQDCDDEDLCDVDGDGYDAEACEGGTDCVDDGDVRGVLAADIHPDAVEICNDVDDNCAGNIVDEGLPTVPWWPDEDDDGWGVPTDIRRECNHPFTGDWADQLGDCDDGDGLVNPDATEVCNDVDDDCDGEVDDGFGTSTWYVDGDGDGWGVQAFAITTCLPLPTPGFADQLGDCDDAHADALPGGAEVCDGLDNDCNGVVDDGLAQQTFYVDADGDGHGDPMLPVSACSAPPATSTLDDDCDDGTATTFEGATEYCNGVDDDCDGTYDEGFSVHEFEADADGDGYGDPNVVITACVLAPPGTVEAGGQADCNDADPTVHPNAPDPPCDGVDSDCEAELPEYIVPDDAAGANVVQNLATNAGQSKVAICYRPGLYASAADPDSIPAIVKTAGLGATPDDVVLRQPPNTSLASVGTASFHHLKIQAHAEAPIAENRAIFDDVHIAYSPSTTYTPDACDGVITGDVTAFHGGSIVEGLRLECTDHVRLTGREADLFDTTIRDMRLTSTSRASSYYGLFAGSFDWGRSEVARVRVEDVHLDIAGGATGAFFRVGASGLQDVDIVDVRLTLGTGLRGGVVAILSDTDIGVQRLRVRDLEITTGTSGGGDLTGALVFYDPPTPGFGWTQTLVASHVDVAGLRLTAPLMNRAVFSHAGQSNAPEVLVLDHASIVGVVVDAGTLPGPVFGQDARNSDFIVRDSVFAWNRPATLGAWWGEVQTEGAVGGHSAGTGPYTAFADPQFVDVRLTATPDDLVFDDPASWDLQLSAGSPYLDALSDQTDSDGSPGDVGAYGGDAGPIDGPWFAWPPGP